MLSHWDQCMLLSNHDQVSSGRVNTPFWGFRICVFSPWLVVTHQSSKLSPATLWTSTSLWMSGKRVSQWLSSPKQSIHITVYKSSPNCLNRGNYNRQTTTNMKLSLLASEIIPVLGKTFPTFSLLFYCCDILK